MKFRVWHIPQIPGEPFFVGAGSPQEAKKILDILADYDLFQFRNKIKPDYANMGGLEYYDYSEKEWLEWHDEETDYDISGMILEDGQLVAK